MRSYPVTTIGELAEGALEGALEGELLEPKKACCKNCGPSSMRGFDDLTVLYNPIVWAAQKLIGAGIAKVTGKDDDSAQPGALDQLANALGVDPVEVAIELTGYSGVGRYWPALQVAGGAAALGGVAYLAMRAIKARRTTKRKAKRG